MSTEVHHAYPLAKSTRTAMTPPHTPESLLALTKSPEELEQLRIIAAELDGWTREANKWGQIVILTPDGDELWHYDSRGNSYGPATTWDSKITKARVPNYPTSLDAIFAAEERLGLHSKTPDPELNYEPWEIKQVWMNHVAGLLGYGCFVSLSSMDPAALAFLPPLLRLIPFILTAQWKEQNA